VQQTVVKWHTQFSGQRSSSFTSLNSSVTVASTLGQSPLKIFISKALPAARPAITVGILLIFMEAIADFGTSQILAVITLTTGVHRTWFLLHDRYSATILSIIELSIDCSHYFVLREC